MMRQVNRMQSQKSPEKENLAPSRLTRYGTDPPPVLRDRGVKSCFLLVALLFCIRYSVHNGVQLTPVYGDQA
jgi:hypothetical protein